MQTHHECSAAADWGAMAACPAGLDMTTFIVVLVSGLVVLGALGAGVWWLVRRMRGY